MKGLFFLCLGDRGGEGGEQRGERKSLMFVIKTTDCLISVQSLSLRGEDIWVIVWARNKEMEMSDNIVKSMGAKV